MVYVYNIVSKYLGDAPIENCQVCLHGKTWNNILNLCSKYIFNEEKWLKKLL